MVLCLQINYSEVLRNFAVNRFFGELINKGIQLSYKLIGEFLKRKDNFALLLFDGKTNF